MGGTTLKPVNASKEAIAALAAVADVVDDENQDISTVPGFATLPPALQATLKNMSTDERKALGKLDKSLRQNGFLVETDSVSLTMF